MYYDQNNNLRKSVIKHSIMPGKEFNTLAYHRQLIENQTIAAYLASQFFKLLSVKSLKFIDVSLILLASEGFSVFLSIEDFITGTFLKWTNNYGFVNQVRVHDSTTRLAYILSKTVQQISFYLLRTNIRLH
jgi:hypothetical protein